MTMNSTEIEILDAQIDKLRYLNRACRGNPARAWVVTQQLAQSIRNLAELHRRRHPSTADSVTSMNHSADVIAKVSAEWLVDAADKYNDDARRWKRWHPIRSRGRSFPEIAAEFLEHAIASESEQVKREIDPARLGLNERKITAGYHHAVVDTQSDSTTRNFIALRAVPGESA